MRESDAVIAIVDDDPRARDGPEKGNRAMSRAPIWTAKILDLPVFSLILIVSVVACGWQWAMAEPAVPGDQRIIHESWTFKDGAPDAVWARAQTADDYLWLGTAAGLYRFDGIRFELFLSPFDDQLLTNILPGCLPLPQADYGSAMLPEAPAL